MVTQGFHEEHADMSARGVPFVMIGSIERDLVQERLADLLAMFVYTVGIYRVICCYRGHRAREVYSHSTIRVNHTPETCKRSYLSSFSLRRHLLKFKSFFIIMLVKVGQFSLLALSTLACMAKASPVPAEDVSPRWLNVPDDPSAFKPRGVRDILRRLRESRNRSPAEVSS
jgi:hypothetical protein